MNYHKFNIGKFECIAFKDKSQVIPLTKQFPQVKEKDLKAALTECGLEEMNPTVGFNCLYINTGFHQIMIDCGYADEGLGENMKAAGISYSDIDAVLITHGDGDHIGGIANFPNAQFYIPEKAYQLWTSKEGQQQLINEFERVFKNLLPAHLLPNKLASRLKYGTEVLPNIKNRLHLIDPRRSIFPGIRMMAAFGHRSDHYVVEIESEEKTLLHIVDAFRHPIQLVRPDWYSFIDSYPEQTVNTIKALIERAKEKDTLLFGAHLAFPGILNLVKN